MQTIAKPKQVFQVFIKATPEKIWEAITRSEYTLQYYFKSTVESDWKPGSGYAYKIEGQPAIVGQVLESKAPHKLVCSFDARWDEQVTPDPPSRISWEIEPMGSFSKVTVVHDEFRSETATYHQVEGMNFILSGLKTLLETGNPLSEAA